MDRKVMKWLTVALAVVGVLTQVGVVPPVVLDVARTVGGALAAVGPV